MELIPIGRLLWRRKLAIGVGIVLAVAAAVALSGPPPAASEVAWTRVALDTPKSQLVDSAPNGYDTLAWRASLLSHLMTTDAVQRELAQRLRVRPDEVAVMDNAYYLPLDPASMPLRAATAADSTVAPYVLTVSMDNPLLPVILLEAAAPTRDLATRLAAAAAALLRAKSSLSNATYSSMIKTGGGAPARLQSFVVQQVAPIRAKPLAAKNLPVKPIGIAVFVLAVWLAAVGLLGRLLHRRSGLAVRAAG
jgi:hypothetical protein